MSNTTPDYEPLLETIRSAVKDLDSGSYQRPKRLAKNLLEATRRDGSLIGYILDTIAPLETNDSSSVYDRLVLLHRILGASSESTKLVGLAWIFSIQAQSPEVALKTLTSFPVGRMSHLFQLQGSLPEVLKEIKTPAIEAVPWFLRIKESIGNDLANAGFWHGVDEWVKFDPTNAAAALPILADQPDSDYGVSLGARILANLRTLGRECPASIKLPEIEEMWSTSSSIYQRTMHHRSWAETALMVKIDPKEVEQFFERIEGADTKETTEGFTFIRCLVSKGALPSDSIDKVLIWLGDRATPDSEPLWKHMLCEIAHSVVSGESYDWSPSQKNGLIEMAIRIQPIQKQHQGTWMEIDQLLAAILKSQGLDATEFLPRLFDSNPSGFHELLERSNQSRLFLNELAVWSGLPTLMLELFSSKMPRRRFGLILINSGLPFRFTQGNLKAINDAHLALGILQLRFDTIRPQQACPLLLQLLPRFEKASDELKNLFYDELSYQARNLPGICLEAFKNVKKPSPLLKKAITDAETYFENLRQASKSPISKIHVPGLNLARRTLSHRRSREIHKTAHESSALLQFMKSVNLLYGSEGFGSYTDGMLTPPTPFQSHSICTEMPRLDLMDYDGNKLRRHQTLLRIRAIESQCRKSNITDDT